MSKLIMQRSASDNVYLHKDFHGALSCAIDYLEQNFGAGAVREYLWQFAHAFYAGLRARIAARGLAPLREHFERIYAAEGGRVRIEMTCDQLVLHVETCPAVAHMREQGYPVARLFSETSRTVNQAIVEGTGFCAELTGYDEATGRSTQVFRRRTA